LTTPIESASSSQPISSEGTLTPARKPKERPVETRPATRGWSPALPPVAAWLADAGLIALFLALTFLLGVFLLKDTDIYWHLRTGAWIRQTGEVPPTDLFTFTRVGVPWIDLHWIFQVGVSWLHERGGVVALNLAKCVVTCVAVLLLVTARRRDWPVWVMLVAWLPAILVLGGRIYVRPETLTLLYLSIFLAVVTRWDRYPALAAVLPIVQLAWVNSHGLFVLGPIVLVCALIDAVLRPGAFALEQRRWWRIVGIAVLATFAACLFNPYGIQGAFFPIQLAGTMSNPVFSKYIAELMPIAQFIEQTGLQNLPLQLHLVTMALGALSFLLPMIWLIGVGLFGTRGPIPKAAVEGKASSTSRGKRKGERRSKGARKEATRSKGPAETVAGWRLSPMRLLLFTAFSLLSLQATRNSHQFAAVVGAVTAWNFGEWAAAIRRRRIALSSPESGPAPPSNSTSLTPRFVAAAAIASVLVWVGSGWFYEMTGEKRTIGLGEEPLWFPHEAARFAGRPEMPERFLSFHNGHASLFEYYHGPERKVYTDPRLEVTGPELFERYKKLQDDITHNTSGWQVRLDEIGRPVILVDHEYNWGVGATLLRDDHWRCIWFDSIAAVFVHDTAKEAVRQHAVDFAARHFRPGPSAKPKGIPELMASAKALRNYAGAMPSHRVDLIRPLVWLGLDDTRSILRDVPHSAAGWTMLGQIEFRREPAGLPSPRSRLRYDPVVDLSIVRSTYALRHGLELGAGDYTTLLSLSQSYENRMMIEAQLPIWDRILGIPPINPLQRDLQQEVVTKRNEYVEKLNAAPLPKWRNLSELEQVVEAMLVEGRAETAADLLEQGYPPARAPWDVLDRLATLRLHLGEPSRARALWQNAVSTPQSAIARSRIGATYLAEEDLESARRAYREALQARPDLFEACYSLAVLEGDAGDATASYELALRAEATAPNELSREAARHLAAGVQPFAKK
jgi:hypothetical protein